MGYDAVVTDDAAVQRAILAACFDEEPDLSALPPRVAVYRRLVRNTLHDVAHKLLPRTREHMGDAFDEDFARFLADQGPRTHYLRDVPSEFVAWAAPRWAAEREPWLADLARHEMASFAIATLPYVAEPHAEEVALDRALLLSSLVRIERYAHAVHELAPHARDEGESSEPRVGDPSPPPARAVALLYYRDAEHELRTLELSPLAAALLARANVALKDAIAAACAETGAPVNDETLASIARLLADLGERGVLLGASPATNQPASARS